MDEMQNSPIVTKHGLTHEEAEKALAAFRVSEARNLDEFLYGYAAALYPPAPVPDAKPVDNGKSA